MKKIFIHGLTASALSSVACLIFLQIYNEAFFVDFSQIINPGSIIASCFIGCLLMALGLAGLFKLDKWHLRGWLNILIAILSFASIIGPISMSLPLDIEFPEMFPGLVVPMHFFPALAFFAVQPFFQNK